MTRLMDLPASPEGMLDDAAFLKSQIILAQALKEIKRLEKPLLS
jgi:hypothetical protein